MFCRGGAGAPAATGVCSAAASYDGGGSRGILTSDMVKVGLITKNDDVLE